MTVLSDFQEKISELLPEIELRMWGTTASGIDDCFSENSR